MVVVIHNYQHKIGRVPNHAYQNSNFKTVRLHVQTRRGWNKTCSCKVHVMFSAPKDPVAELQKVARDEKVSFGMATLHFVGKFESQVYYQTLWYSYYYTFI